MMAFKVANVHDNCYSPAFFAGEEGNESSTPFRVGGI